MVAWACGEVLEVASVVASGVALVMVACFLAERAAVAAKTKEAVQDGLWEVHVLRQSAATLRLGLALDYERFIKERCIRTSSILIAPTVAVLAVVISRLKPADS